MKILVNRVIMTAPGKCGLRSHPQGSRLAKRAEKIVDCAGMPLTAARRANSAGIESVGDLAKGREPGSLDRSSSRPGRKRQYPNCAAMRSAAVATARRRPPPGPVSAAGRSSTRGAHISLGISLRRQYSGRCSAFQGNVLHETVVNFDDDRSAPPKFVEHHAAAN